MKFKEFRDWCNQRVCDGCWGLQEAIICINIIENINREPFWKREKIWKKDYMHIIENYIVMPINKKIIELQGDKI